jgi:hypothetical protein
MSWLVSFHDDFEFDELPEEVQDELLARLEVLAEFGPQLGRPQVDTLNGSSFPNMKELRFRKDGYGALLLRLTHCNRRSCWLARTRKVKARQSSIKT